MAELRVKEITTFNYKRPAIKKGYANQTLHVDLSSAGVVVKPVSGEMKEIFVGGKGFGLWLLWNSPDIKIKGKSRVNLPNNLIDCTFEVEFQNVSTETTKVATIIIRQPLSEPGRSLL